MNILLVSDLHYALPQLDWVVGVADDFDLVVLAGDHLNIASSVPLEAQSVVILRYVELIQEKTTLVISSGNHDLTGPDDAGEQAALWLPAVRANNVPTDGDSVELDDTLVTVCPWWDGDVGKAGVAEQLARDGGRRTGRWIWVYHWPPIGSPTCWTGNRHYGDPDLAEWIAEHQPDIVLTGHVHQSPFKPDGSWVDRIGRTWVFNAGQQTGPFPATVELDLEANVASWHSLAGHEEQPLDDSVPAPRTTR